MTMRAPRDGFPPLCFDHFVDKNVQGTLVITGKSSTLHVSCVLAMRTSVVKLYIYFIEGVVGC